MNFGGVKELPDIQLQDVRSWIGIHLKVIGGNIYSRYCKEKKSDIGLLMRIKSEVNEESNQWTNSKIFNLGAAGFTVVNEDVTTSLLEKFKNPKKETQVPQRFQRGKEI